MRKWVLNFIEITILVVISLACVVAILQNTLFKDKSVFGYRTYVIASNSMYPVLEYGDVILVKEIDYDEIEVNDIVTYQGLVGEFKNKVITHEVIEIFYEKDEKDEKVLKTKGRANTGVDPSVYEEQVYGKFTYRFVLISFISKIVRNELGFILFIFIPFGILFVLEFINMIKETKRRELEKLVQQQLDEIKKIDNDSKEAVEIERTMCVQLEQIRDAKRDFKKMNELEHTVRVPLEDIIRKIEFFKNASNKDDENELLLENTMVLFDSDDIRKAISKELKLKDKKINKNKKENGKKKKRKDENKKVDKNKKKSIDKKNKEV